MSKFVLAIATDGAAFHDDEDETLNPAELARLLRCVADRVESHEWAGTVMDANGNSVGAFIHEGE